MAAKGLKSIIFPGVDILSTEVDDTNNTILVQTGDAVSGTPGHKAEWWQTVGFASRPSQVSPTGNNADCCQAIIIPQADYDIAIGARDTRYQKIYGSLKDGETCIYATGSDGTAQARIMLKSNGSINLFTKQGNSPTGTGMGIFIDPNADSITCVNGKGFGFIIDDTGVKIFTNKASHTLGSDGSIKSIATQVNQVDGSSVVLGSSPAMLPGINSVLCGISGVLGKPSLKVLAE